MPQRRELARGEDPLSERRQRVALATFDPPAVERRAGRGESSVPRSTSRFSAPSARSSEAIRSHVRRSAGADHGCRRRTAAGAGPRARRAARRPRPSSGRASSRAPRRSRERRASWRLNRCLAKRSNNAGAGVSASCTNAGSIARADRVHQPVDRRLALVLEAVERLHAPDELRALLQAQHRAAAAAASSRAPSARSCG